MKPIGSIVVLVALLSVVGAVACIEETTVEDLTALEQMELAFEGAYTQEQIKPILDQAMALYGLTITEDNYSRAASSLIVLRQNQGVEEVDILDYMIRSHVVGVNLSFPAAAALAAVFLAAGDR